jgi:hypothetical protein
MAMTKCPLFSPTPLAGTLKGGDVAAVGSA